MPGKGTGNNEVVADNLCALEFYEKNVINNYTVIPKNSSAGTVSLIEVHQTFPNQYISYIDLFQ